MPFDPAQPAANSPLSSQTMRAQLNGLKEIIDSTLQGPPGPEGPQGPAGEVTQQQLNNAMAQATYDATNVSSANSNGVAVLEIQISDPPTQGNVQALMDKLNELIMALRR